MTRENPYEHLLAIMPDRLYELLRMMFSRWRHWRPQLGYDEASAGFGDMVSGKSFNSWDDLEEAGDNHALVVLETAYAELGSAEKIAVQVALREQPDVWQVRGGIEAQFVTGLAKLEKSLSRQGCL